MVEDARFEDADEHPIHLKAFDAEDLQVMSALVQDAVLPVSELSWRPSSRRFGMLINRFRWERGGAGKPERVQSVLAFEDVLSVASQGFDRSDSELVLSVLSLQVEPKDDGAARIEVVLAGDGAIALQVEAIEATLKDVTRPYGAPSGKTPKHEL